MILALDIVALTAARCTEENSHVFSAMHCGYPAPGYPDSFIFTPFFRIGSFDFTKPMLLALVCMAGRGRLLLGRVRQAEAGAARRAEPGEMGIAVRPGPDPAADDGQARRRLPAVPGRAVLLRLDHEPDGDHPGRAVPGDVVDRVPGRADADGLRDLHLPGHQAPGPGRLLQEHGPHGRAVRSSCSSWRRSRSCSTSSSGRSPWRSGCSRTCSPGTSCCWCSRWPPGTCSAPRIGLLFSATSFILTIVLTGLRDADPGAAGLYLHHPDRPVHRRVAGSGPLTWPGMGARARRAREALTHNRRRSPLART